MSAQLVVGPHSSASLIRSNSAFTVDNITTNGLSIGTTIDLSGDLNVTGNINTNGSYFIENIEVLNENSLGTGITSSNLQEVGILNDLIVDGDLSLTGDLSNTADILVTGDVDVSNNLNVILQ